MDIVAELLEPIWIDRESTVILDNLQARTGKARDEIVAEALKFYEDALNAIDNSRKRTSSMSMEVNWDGCAR